MSPFPQSVPNPSAFSTVFFVPSPVSFVLSPVPKNLRGHDGFGDKVS